MTDRQNYDSQERAGIAASRGKSETVEAVTLSMRVSHRRKLSDL